MANFPASLPNISENNTPSVTLAAYGHTAHHVTLADELNAVATKVGIDSSADTTSLDYLVKNTNSNNVTFSHASGINTNTISERTAANGVAVDGLNIKDGKLNTNNSVVTANITDSAVTTAKIADGDVTTAKIDDNAVTNSSTSDTFSDPALGSATWTSISMNKSFTTSGGKVIATFTVNARFQGTNTLTFCQMRLKRDSTVLLTSDIWGGIGIANVRMAHTLSVEETPAADTYTYDIEISNPNATDTVNVQDANLLLIETKK